MQTELQFALNETIRHWKGVLKNKDGTAAWNVGGEHCALCRLCLETGCVYKGEKCPVFAKTGLTRARCVGTPYNEYVSALTQIRFIEQTYYWWFKPFALWAAERRRKKLAQEMIDLLVSACDEGITRKEKKLLKYYHFPPIRF